MTRFLLCLCSFVLLQAAPAAELYFIATSQQGAQTQIDTAHSAAWLMTVTEDFDLTGALLTMKAGPGADSPLSFTLYERNAGIPDSLIEQVDLTYAEFCAQVTNCGSYDDHRFAFSGNISLSANRTYLATLTSLAPDRQNTAYFIKSTDFFVSDENGVPVQPQPITFVLGSQNGTVSDPPAAVPEPSTCALMGVGFSLAALSCAWRRVRGR